MNEVPGPSSTQTTPPSEANLEAFKQLFPGVIQDGALDAVRLGELLDTPVSGVKEGKERFGLMWAGKKRAVEALQTPSMAALVPDKEASINWDTAENVFIEGDNLEVLKLLQKAYNDQVKLIYIDPPYNTGNDFVYNDDFSDPLQHYLEVTGQVDADGNRLVANTETSGRKHSNWLTMMYPRLVLARNLMAQEGLICISIDDNEASQLKMLLDEVFGQENFIGNFAWVSNLKGRQISGSGAAGTKEYILVYARDHTHVTEFRAKASWLKALMPSVYKGFDYEVLEDEYGPYVLKNELYNTNSIFNEVTRPNLVYDIFFSPTSGEINTATVSDNPAPKGFVKISPKRNNNGAQKYHAYRWGRDKVLNEPHNLEFKEVNGAWKVFTKVRDVDSTTVKDLIMDISTSAGSSDLEKIGFDSKLFDYPKPVDLISFLVGVLTSGDDLILDFFAGSGTTGHAVLDANTRDEGKRRFVLVTLNEPVAQKSHASAAGFETVSQISLARLKKVFETHLGLGNPGLRALKLAPSNFIRNSPSKSEQLLLDELTLVGNADSDALCIEISLNLGERLDVTCTPLESFPEGTFGIGKNLIHANMEVNESLISKALDSGYKTVAFLEDAFKGKDSLKANSYYLAKTQNIEFKTF
jgi:adenine-specific DNA-methyltransferase